MKQIEKYNPAWANLYKTEEEKLKNIIKEEIVELMHVGSTSIEGLSARPIIDILVCVKQLNDIPKKDLIDTYTVLNDKKGELILANNDESIIIYIIANNSYRKDDFTMFRDHLLLHPKRLKEFNQFKEDFMNSNNYKNYEFIKKKFIESTIELHKEIYMI